MTVSDIKVYTTNNAGTPIPLTWEPSVHEIMYIATGIAARCANVSMELVIPLLFGN